MLSQILISKWLFFDQCTKYEISSFILAAWNSFFFWLIIHYKKVHMCFQDNLSQKWINYCCFFLRLTAKKMEQILSTISDIYIIEYWMFPINCRNMVMWINIHIGLYEPKRLVKFTRQDFSLILINSYWDQALISYKMLES